MLSNVNTPNDLKNLKYWELQALADDIRKEIATTVSQNGGHLASNLGIVETTIALHRVFDFSKDSLVFDVGHQCYAHKLLTGRKEQFSTLRRMGGISGFTNRFESEYDAVTAGHSGPSISVGLGIAKSNKLNGNDNFVVSVVGDGSFTNGMIYEALNNCYDKKLKFIIILNDNEMSISSNVGNISNYFSTLRTSKKYFKIKRKIKNGFSKVPVIGEGLVNMASEIKAFFKRHLIRQNEIFSALDMRYLGPVDGHDIKRLEDVFEEAKSYNECTIILIKTKKGKGYERAENKPENYHSVGKFSLAEGISKASSTCFSEEFGKIMVKEADKDEKIVTLTSAMCEGTGLLEFSKRFPDRFFDVGIAEEHEVAFAAGLSVGGMKPVCAIYSTFSQRVYDQAFHDLSVQELPCIFALDRAGFVPDDGITHQGLFDVSLFSSVPSTTIYSPETYDEMRASFEEALSNNHLSIVRYPKGKMLDYDRSGFTDNADASMSLMGEQNADIVIITYGRITHEAYKAYERLKNDFKVKIVKLVKIYPLDENTIINTINNARLVYILEEGIKSGGVGEKISAFICGKTKASVVVRAVENENAFHATVEQLIDYFGLSCEKVCEEIRANLK